VTPEEVPAELIELLDLRAGRTHSRTGSVVAALAEILTRYDELRCEHLSRTAAEFYDAADFLDVIGRQMRELYRTGNHSIEYINGWEDAATRLELRAEAMRRGAAAEDGAP
jgi:hypothetical protein